MEIAWLSLPISMPEVVSNLLPRLSLGPAESCELMVTA